MDRISFSCPGCSVKLAVSLAHAGKTAACPKCRRQTQVPAPAAPNAPEELVLDLGTAPEPALPPPSPPEPAEAPQPSRSKYGARFSDDDEETAGYGLAGAARPAAPATATVRGPERRISEWWPDGAKLNLPFSWRTPLQTARDHAEGARWMKALGLLNELFRQELKADASAPVVRKPLSFCLGRWAARELDRLEEDGTKPSKPIRKVLKLASEKHRFGGSFEPNECPLCARRRDHLVGTQQVRTVAGSAYLCCAAPTRDDVELVGAVDRINKKLVVGMGLDSDNAEIPAALARLPDWYRAVHMTERGWTQRIVDKSGGGGDGGGGFVFGFSGDGGELAANLIAGLLG